MAWHQHGWVQPFQVGYRALDLGLFARGEMEPAYHSVQRRLAANELARVLCSVDYAGVAAACENDESFPWKDVRDASDWNLGVALTFEVTCEKALIGNKFI